MNGNNRVKRQLGGAVYLDYAATTPVAPEVVEAMSRCMGREGIFGNPASRSHRFGQEAREAVEEARAHVAESINAEPAEIVWTSGATESVNLAIKGVARGAADRRHVVTSSMEHKAVLDTCGQLEREGHEITRIEPDAAGLISPERVGAALRDDTILVSLMHVNNEVGTITDISAIGEMTRARRIVLHVDAAQGAARLPIDVQELGADLVSLSGHKMYGPKGVGVLFVGSSCPSGLEPQMHGGEQEQGLRSGTLPTHQIVGMGRAAQLVLERRRRDAAAVSTLDSRFLGRLQAIPDTFLNGNQEHRVPGIVNVGFAGADNEALMLAIGDKVAVSSGSACTSSRVEPSHVLSSLGLSEELSNCSVRFSLGRFTTASEVDHAAALVAEAVDALRELSSGCTRQSDTDVVGVGIGPELRRAIA